MWGEGKREKKRNKRNKKYGKKRTNKKKEKDKEYKIGFWNVVSMKNKVEDFREKLKKWDMIFLSETRLN